MMTSARGLSKLGSGAGGRILVVVSQPVCVFGNENKLTETDNKFQIMNLLVKGNKFIGKGGKTSKKFCIFCLIRKCKISCFAPALFGIIYMLKNSSTLYFFGGRKGMGRNMDVYGEESVSQGKSTYSMILNMSFPQPKVCMG